MFANRPNRLALFATALLLTLPLGAQTQQGDILGTIRDPQAAGVPNAEIRITNQTTGALRTLASNESGDYLALGFFPGVYRVEVTLTGFQKTVVENVRVEPQARVRLDIPMRVGEVASEVTVEGEFIQTEGATVDITLPQVYVEKKAVNPSRDGWALEQSMWFPGSSGGGVGWGGFGGVPMPHLEYQSDGAQQNRELMLPSQSIQQVSLTMGTPSAEYGRPVTANVIFRTGTNQLHGEYSPNYVNPRTNAVNTPQVQNVRPAGLNQWRHEWGLSGPVYIPKIYDGRNKTFFLFNYYMVPPLVTAGAYVTSIPSERMLGGNFSRFRDRNGNVVPITDPLAGSPFPGNIVPVNRINSVSQKVIQDMVVDSINGFGPRQYVGDPDSVFQNAQYAFRDERKSYSSVIKIDQNFGSNHVVSGSFNKGRREFFKDGTGMPGWSRVSQSPEQRINIGHTWVVTPRIVNQLRVADARVGDHQFTPRSFRDRTPMPGGEMIKRWGVQGVTDNGLSGAPKFLVTDGLGVFLDHNTQQGGRDEVRFQVYENLSYTTGRHTIKGGFLAIAHRQERLSNLSESFGRFTFNGRFTGVPFADFLIGTPDVSQRAETRPTINEAVTELGGYIQDDWRVRPNLTLSLGLRWDRYSVPRETNGLFFNFDAASGKMVVPDQAAVSQISRLWPVNSIPVVVGSSVGFAENLRNSNQRLLPRFGFAYRPKVSSDLAIRGGFGVYNSILRFQGLQTEGPFALTEEIQNAMTPAGPRFSLPNPFGAAAGAARGVATGQSVSRDLRPEYIMTWNLTVEKSVLPGWVARATYNANRTVQQMYQFNLNTPLASAQPFNQARRPFPAFQNITSVENGVNSRYNSLLVGLTHAFKNGLHMDITHTIQRGRRDGPSQGFSADTLSGNVDYAYDRARDSQIDAWWPTQDLLINLYYELPFGNGKRFLSVGSGAGGKILNAIVGGWSLTTNFNWHTGNYSTPTYTGYDSANLNQFSGRPDLVPGCNLYTNPSRMIANQPFVNGACFTAPAPGTLGNAPINLLVGPNMWILNGAPFKEFKLYERAMLRVGASFYNALNNGDYWGAPNGNIGAFARQANGSLALRPAINSLASATNWVRRTQEGNGARKVYFQASLRF